MMTTCDEPIAPLALNEKQAAKALGISERTLLTLRQDGDVPFKKVRGRILYPVSQLQDWLTTAG